MIQVAPPQAYRFVTNSNKSTEPVTATMRKKDHVSDVREIRIANSLSLPNVHTRSEVKRRASTQIIDKLNDWDELNQGRM